MKKIILIPNEFRSLFPDHINDCVFECLYKSVSKIDRILRKAFFCLHIPFYKFLFSDWFFNMEEYKEIIIFDTGNLNYIYTIFKKKFPNIKIIVWFWNNVNQTINPKKLIRKGADIWSFDYDDVNKYGFKYNSQFFVKTKMIFPYKRYSQDVFYVGKDKDRAQILSQLIAELNNNNLTYNINLVKSANSINNYGIEYKEPMKYEDVLKNTIESRAIIDLVSYAQNGLTLRPLEALYYKKKLITNMKNITNYNFYKKNNIFIIGVDDFSELNEFITSDYDDSDWDKVVNYYEFDEWQKRFDS